jgi:hypothetical protein
MDRHDQNDEKSDMKTLRHPCPQGQEVLFFTSLIRSRAMNHETRSLENGRIPFENPFIRPTDDSEIISTFLRRSISEKAHPLIHRPQYRKEG